MRYFFWVLIMSLGIWGGAYAQSVNAYGDYPSDSTYQFDSSYYNNYRPDTTTTTTAYSKFDAGDFRNTVWGMTKEEVRQSETAEHDNYNQQLSDRDGLDVLCYKGEYAGQAAYIQYWFEDDSLAAADFLFYPTIKYFYMSLFERVKDTVNADYWPANYDSKDETSMDLQNNPTIWEDAIWRGEQERKAVWATDRSFITLDMWGEDDKVTLELKYVPADQ